MSLNTLLTAVSGFVRASHVNNIASSLINSFVGRNSSGVPTAGKDLGTDEVPWGSAHIGSLFLGGNLVSAGDITTAANQITSGQVRSTSNQPDFLRANGAAASFLIEGLATTLSLVIKGSVVNVTTDITKSGLAVAPASNNTCDINDTGLSGTLATKYQGEEDNILTIDAVGSEISGRVGFIIALKTSSNEIMYGLLESSTTIKKMFRGYFFDSSGDPIVRETISNNDTLTLMELGWVFMQNNGTTVDVSYVTPIISNDEPLLGLDGNGLTDGQYWFDVGAEIWKRHDGISFVDLGRTIVGLAVIDGTNCIATRSFDFLKSFKNDNSAQLKKLSSTVVDGKKQIANVSAYGKNIIFQYSPLEFDTATDFESGVSEADNTLYYLYVSDTGQTKISNEKWYRRDDLKGRYHPYNSWRAIGEVNNDNSSNFEDPVSYVSFTKIQSLPMIIWRLNTNDITGNNTPIGSAGGKWEIANTEATEAPLGITSVTESNGTFSFSSTGHWLVRYNMQIGNSTGASVQTISLQSTDGVSASASLANTILEATQAGQTVSGGREALLKIEDVSIHKVWLANGVTGDADILFGNANTSYMIFQRLADL